MVIVTEGLTKDYHLGPHVVHALRGVSVAVERGEFLGVMGPSGSGKSTFMNLLGCLDTPTEGRYLIDGEDVAGLDRDALAKIRSRKIGFVFQGFNLLPRTSALENVELPMLYDRRPDRGKRDGRKRDTHALAVAALERVGLGERIDHQPNELSGGQQQRVAIARSFANDPVIILADEPTGNLDLKTGKEIIDLLRIMNKERGVTIISATHDLKMIDVSDRVVWIRDGHLERIEERSEIQLNVGQMEGEEA